MSKTTHVNPISGRAFSPVEAASLDEAMKQRRFKQPQWATYQQWRGTGRAVDAAEKSRGVMCTSATGFSWRVYNVAQLEGEKAAVARAPVARKVATPKAKAAPKAAPELKSSPARASAPAVTAKPHVAIVASNPTVKRSARTRYLQKPGVSGGASVAEIDKPQALPDTVESAREIMRLNGRLNLTEGEARELVRAFPTRRFFEPDEVASIYAGQPMAAITEQGRHRIAEGKRWRKLWEAKAKTSRKIGALKTWAWLVFTGRTAEAEKYRKAAAARRPGVE